MNSAYSGSTYFGSKGSGVRNLPAPTNQINDLENFRSADAPDIAPETKLPDEAVVAAAVRPHTRANSGRTITPLTQSMTLPNRLPAMSAFSS